MCSYIIGQVVYQPSSEKIYGYTRQEPGDALIVIDSSDYETKEKLKNMMGVGQNCLGSGPSYTRSRLPDLLGLTHNPLRVIPS